MEVAEAVAELAVAEEVVAEMVGVAEVVAEMVGVAWKQRRKWWEWRGSSKG